VAAACARLKTPADCRDLALLVARFHGDIRRGPELRAATVSLARSVRGGRGRG
jgi:tRNA nucleotidyltransferase (CCA-adding enzyme)